MQNLTISVGKYLLHVDRSRRHRCCGLSRAPRGYVKMHLDTMYHRLCPHGSRKPTRGFSSAIYCCRACAHDRPFERPAAQPRRCAFAVPARFRYNQDIHNALEKSVQRERRSFAPAKWPGSRSGSLASSLQASEGEHCTLTAVNGMLFPLPSPNLDTCCSSALRVR